MFFSKKVTLLGGGKCCIGTLAHAKRNLLYATDVPLQQMCHCHRCAIATDVPLQHMCHCNICAHATHVPMQHMRQSFSTSFDGFQGKTVLHWHIGACKLNLKVMQYLRHCNKSVNATNLSLQQMLHCNKCAIATPASSIYDSSQDLFMKYGVALAHVLQ